MLREKLRGYVENFNNQDDELYRESIPNDAAYAFLAENIPLLDCPDKELELTYYFRWWAFRKHIRKTEDGYVMTEFFPDVDWAGKHNTIACAAGEHIAEGRWLRDKSIVKDYCLFWYRGGGNLQGYTNRVPQSMAEFALLRNERPMLLALLPDMVADTEKWEKGFRVWNGERVGQAENGLFRTTDDRDGCEMSIGGNGYRPMLNCAMIAYYKLIFETAVAAEQSDLARKFAKKAEKLKALYLEKAWHKKLGFFTVISDDGKQTDVRELCGYAPWYFGLVKEEGCEAAFSQLTDARGFYAPYGLTYPEQRHKDFKIVYGGHPCQWNGPVWPFTSSFALTAVQRLLKQKESAHIDKKDYYRLLLQYARCHRRLLSCGEIIPWIDENLNPYTGDWISRTVINEYGSDPEWKGKERGREYNHSTFCDNVISGLFGITPCVGHFIEINPLLPEGVWDWFKLENIPYKDFLLTLIWDKTGTHYSRGQGFTVLKNGKPVAVAPALSKQKIAIKT
jgi:hypothetical protein